MRCSRIRIKKMDAASADRSRPSSTNTVTSDTACVIWRETRRTTRHAWRRLDSGFVSAIKFYRVRMGLSVRSDVAGRGGGGSLAFKYPVIWASCDILETSAEAPGRESQGTAPLVSEGVRFTPESSRRGSGAKPCAHSTLQPVKRDAPDEDGRRHLPRVRGLLRRRGERPLL